MLRCAWLVICAGLLASCAGIAVPQATPTVQPTRTPSITPQNTEIALEPSRTPLPTSTTTSTSTDVPPTQTNIPTATASNTNLPTASFTPIDTNAPTLTPTFTATVTPSFTVSNTNAPTATPSLTASATFTATASNTNQPTSTPLPTATETPIPSPTPLPTIGATATFTPQPTPTFTGSPSNTVPPPPPPTLTPIPASSTPDLTQTFVANLSITPSPAPSFTPFPTASATFTLTPATLDVTPIFITAGAETQVPDDLALTLTPIESTETFETFELTPTLAPTVENVIPPPTVGIATLQALPPSGSVTTRNFILGPGGSGTVYDLGSSVSNPTLLLQNPRFPEQFIATDRLGLLYTINSGSTQAISGKMFVGAPGEPRENNGFVNGAAWSPDGTKIAFIVDAWSVKGPESTADDGVWFTRVGEFVGDGNQLLRHCPANEASNQCGAVQRNDFPYFYRTVQLVWSPNSDRVLATLVYRDEGGNQRTGVMVLTPGASSPNVRPPMLFYEYGDWSGDGSRIVVSGRNRDGQMVLGSVNLDGSDFRGSALDLSLRNGVQSGSGLIALGRQGDPNGAYRIYDQSGTALTGDIGFAAPQDVKWNPARNAIYVQTTDGRRYIAYTNGNVQDITDAAAGAAFVNWGSLPPNSGTSLDLGSGSIPSGVVEGSRFQAGQQLRVLSPTGVLNLRQSPSTTAPALVANGVPNGSYVAILAGPVVSENIEWWQVQIAGGLQGWMAGRIGNDDVLVP